MTPSHYHRPRRADQHRWAHRYPALWFWAGVLRAAVIAATVAAGLACAVWMTAAYYQQHQQEAP